MSKENADIYGKTGSEFTITVDSGQIKKATLGKTSLKIEADGQTIDLPSLPDGDSKIAVGTIFGEGDSDANITVGTVTSGEAHAADPPGVLDHTEVDGTILLYGEA
jgi:hypothetical protein